MTLDERDLLRRFRLEEPGAFEELYANYADRVYRFCYRLCGRVADAEDLTQEVFLAAYRGLERFEGRASLSTWLYRVSFYRWRAMRAREMNRIALDDEEAVPLVSSDSSAAELQKIALTRAISSLTEEQREAFILVKVEGLKYREATEVLGVPQGTIQFRVHEAVGRLRVLLRDAAAPTKPVESGRKEEVKPCVVKVSEGN